MDIPPHSSPPMFSTIHDSPTSYSPSRRVDDPIPSTSPSHYVTTEPSHYDDRRPPGLSSSPSSANGSYFPPITGAPMSTPRPRRDSFSSRSSESSSFVSRRNSVDTRLPHPSSRSPPQESRSAPTSNASSRPRMLSISTRNVRWDQNLVCPSPVPLEERRKGWFNRRGYVFFHLHLHSALLCCYPLPCLLHLSLSSDQLWTNSGSYKPPLPGEEYPRDLHFYPEVGQGWMNEEGIKIDMQHRLIPKVPQKSALKRPVVPRHGNTW